MKKVITLLATVLLLSAISMVACAKEDSDAEWIQRMREKFQSEGYTEVPTESLPQMLSEADTDPETYELAYADMEKADAQTREKILDARRKVAYSMNEWYADSEDFCVVVYNEETKEWHVPPKYSDLFPDWEPLTEYEEKDVASVVAAMAEPLSAMVQAPVMY